MLEHQHTFDSLLQGGDTSSVAVPAIRMTWLSGSGFLLLQSPSESALQDAVMSHMGLPLAAPQTASTRGEYALLWLAPTEWLLGSPASETESLRAALTRRLTTRLAAVTDMSDALAVCEVSGTRSADILMSGCTLDLRADAFPAGRSARTGLADISAIVWNPGESLTASAASSIAPMRGICAIGSPTRQDFAAFLLPNDLVAASRHGHCLNSILHRWSTGTLPIKVVAVVSNHQDTWSSRIHRW